MKLHGILLAAAVISLVPAARTDDALNAIVESTNRFSASLYQVLSENGGNMVVSPFSVDTVLSMLSMGLVGETANTVSAALYHPQPGTREVVQQGFKKLLTSLQSLDGVTVDIANKIYIEKTFKVKDAFRQAVQQYFLSAAEQVDMAHNSKAARLAINAWAAEKTHNKIQDLLPEGTPGSDSVLVLLNALYFKGFWEQAFDKQATRLDMFRLSAASSKKVPMMHVRARLEVAEFPEQHVSILKLPYKGGKYSMLILLPKEVDGLRQVEANIHSLTSSFISNSFQSALVDVRLPKFKILSTIDLNNSIRKLGMGKLFEGGRDFWGIAEKDLAVSKAIQKAFIQVDEEGTEAAAASAVSIFVKSGKIEPDLIEFSVDHPFMFMIIEEEKGTILFMGRVEEPRE